MAFSVTDFKQKGISKGGARSALFSVSLRFPSKVSAANLNTEFLIKGASIPAYSIGTYDVFYHGKAIKIAGDHNYDTWETTIINDQDFAIRKALEQWMDLISNRQLNTRNKEVMTDGAVQTGYKKNLKVTQFQSNGEEVPHHYHIRNAFPTNLSAIALDWASADIEEYTCTWTFDSWHTEEQHGG